MNKFLGVFKTELFNFTQIMSINDPMFLKNGFTFIKITFHFHLMKGLKKNFKRRRQFVFLMAPMKFSLKFDIAQN